VDKTPSTDSSGTTDTSREYELVKSAFQAGMLTGVGLLARETGATIPDETMQRFIDAVPEEAYQAVWREIRERMKA
jgi:hypothetical protein